MSPIHGWLHRKPAPEVWAQNPHQTSTFSAPSPRHCLRFYTVDGNRRGHHPQAHICRHKMCSRYCRHAIILCPRCQQQDSCRSQRNWCSTGCSHQTNYSCHQPIIGPCRHIPQLWFNIHMDGYIGNLLLKFGHKAPTKPRLSLHCHHDIVYGSIQ